MTTSAGVPLGAAEEALWLLQRLVPDRGVSNVAVSITGPAAVSLPDLDEAFGWLVGRHDMLRSTFPMVNGRPHRLPRPADAVAVTVEAARSTTGSLVADLRRFAGAPFDLEHGPLARVGLFTVTGACPVICVVAHHLAVDHAALQILVAELLAAYRARAAGTPPDLPAPPPVRPPREPSPEAVRYWRSSIADAVPPAALRGARPVPETPTFAGDCITGEIDPDARVAVDTLRRRLRATPNIILLSAYFLLLARHGAGPDVTVGVMLNARRDEERDAPTMGYRVDTVPLRVRVDPEAGFATLVGQVRDALLLALSHPHVSYESLVRGATGEDAGSGSWRTRLFRHLFNFRPRAVTVGGAGSGGAPVEVSHVDTGLARFDLELSIDINPPRSLCQLVFSTEVHDGARARGYLDRYVALLTAAAQAPEEPVRFLDIRPPGEREIVAAVNRTARRWPPPDSVAAQFHQHARSAATAPAVLDGDVSVSYGQLAAAAAQTREILVGLGVGPGDVVAVGGARCARTAAALLGIWAAGAAYLPLDPALPAARIEFELADSGCRWVIDGDDLPAGGTGGAGLIPSVDPAGLPGSAGRPGDTTAVTHPDPQSSAYIIYTSGSAGVPKGVRLTHANLHNVVRSFASSLAAGPDDAMLWLTTLAFDISALELWLPLTVGARVVVGRDDLRARPAALADVVTAAGVTVVQATPTTWRLLVGDPRARVDLSGVRVLCGGEPLSWPLAERLLATRCTLYNVYGPTETTIWSTVAEIRPGAGRVTVGRPIANTSVHVLDDNLDEVGLNETGELCIGGNGVAPGYVNLPDETAAAFRTHPRLGRLYRTGDLARLTHDGSLELLGRRDRQVKIRAHRIELGEVESVLEEHPHVRVAAVVVGRSPDGEAVLVAHIIAADPQCDHDDLWRHAADRLPPYAVPAHITLVDRLPLTASGKIDYRGLGAGTVPVPDVRGGAPLPDDPLTARLVDLWREVLAVTDPDENVNFFLNGGHSLLAVELAARAGDLCSTRVDLIDVFRAPTPARLADLVRRRRADNGGR